MGLESFCARIWRVYPTPLEKMPTYRTGPIQASSPAQSGVSITSISPAESTAITRNCTQDRATPSTFRVKWSISRMCPAKQKEHSSTYQSPSVMEKDSCTHSRYNPTTASATLSQIARGAFCRRKIPAMGTMTI